MDDTPPAGDENSRRFLATGIVLGPQRAADLFEAVEVLEEAGESYLSGDRRPPDAAIRAIAAATRILFKLEVVSSRALKVLQDTSYQIKNRAEGGPGGSIIAPPTSKGKKGQSPAHWNCKGYLVTAYRLQTKMGKTPREAARQVATDVDFFPLLKGSNGGTCSPERRREQLLLRSLPTLQSWEKELSRKTRPVGTGESRQRARTLKACCAQYAASDKHAYDVAIGLANQELRLAAPLVG
jgi:hypothetical protein